VAEELVETQPEGGSDDGAGGVRGPVDPEDAAPHGGVGVDHEQGIAGGPADALADPVHRPPRQDDRPQHRDGDKDLPHRGEAVTDGDKGTPRPGVAQPPRDQLRHRGHPLGHPLDDADDRDRRPQGGGQEDRQDRVEQLAGRILQEAHPGQRPHVRRQPPPPHPPGPPPPPESPDPGGKVGVEVTGTVWSESG